MHVHLKPYLIMAYGLVYWQELEHLIIFIVAFHYLNVYVKT